MVLIWRLLCVMAVVGVLRGREEAGLTIGEENIVEHWEQMERELSRLRVLRVEAVDLSESSLLRVLSLELPQLEELHFSPEEDSNRPSYIKANLSPQILTQKLVRAIFQSQYFPRLRVLNLKGTNIDDRALAFLALANLTTALQQLSLERCFVSRAGFEHLARVRFTSLTHLNISRTMLAEESAVDALITLICGQGEDECANKLEGLDISKTNIQREPFVRLMRRLEAKSLRSLSLKELSLSWRATYAEGRDYTAFELLASRFPALELLELQDAQVDDTVAALFAKQPLPALTRLGLSKNHLTDLGAKAWLTRSNLPLLESLSLYSNEVGDETLAHLVAEGFELTKFYFGDCRFTAAGVEHLKQLRTERLEKLYLEVPVSAEALAELFGEGGMKNLRELALVGNDLLANVFQKVAWAQLRRLEVLSFLSCNIQASLATALQNYQPGQPSLFPALRVLVLSNARLTDELAMYLLGLQQAFFPRLEEMVVAQDMGLNVGNFIGEVLGKAQLREGLYFVINGFEAQKRGNQHQLIGLPVLDFLLFDGQSSADYDELIAKIPSLVAAYDFSRLATIYLQHRPATDMLFRILEEAKISSLPHLQELSLGDIMDVDFLLQAMGGVKMAGVRELSLRLVVPADAEADCVEDILRLLEKFPNLNQLMLSVTFLNDEDGFLLRKQLLDQLYFPHLTHLALNNQNLEVEEVAGLLAAHNRTLRSINLENNFMETELLGLLAEQEYVLAALSLSSTSFQPAEFAVLGEVDCQFLEYLAVAMSDLTNDHLFALLAAPLARNASLLFPKLVYLDLDNNDIRKEGLEALLGTGLHDLEILTLARNSNPQFLNLLLSYPTRIQLLEAVNVEVYGMDEQLEPRAALGIKEIMLKTQSFLREDFRSLGRLSFSTLEHAQFEIFNVYDCEVLGDLLRISEWAHTPEFRFSNDQPGLHSACLADLAFASHIYAFQIIDNFATTDLTHFAERILNTSLEIKYLVLHNTRLPPDFFSRVFRHAYEQLQVVSLKNNYVGDAAMKEFLKHPLPNVLYLELKDADVGDATVEALARSSMPELQYLSLDGNRLTGRAVKALGTMQTERLVMLSLERCELEREALEAFGYLELGSLRVLQLSGNLFSGLDLLTFVSALDRKSFPVLTAILAKGIVLSKDEHDAIKAVLTPKYIQFELDPPQNAARVNSAHY